MTQEDIQLLSKDLAARLPYGVKVLLENEGERLTGVLDAIFPNENRAIVTELNKPIAAINVRCGGFDIEENIVRPYLRLMSSMTKEEKREYLSFIGGKRPFDCDFSAYPIEYTFVYEHDINSYIDWFNKHHFDYRGLIEKGLALEAPEGMYNIKKK